MNKKIYSALLGATIAMPVMAGGLVTNTNQNAAFLRQLSQDGIIDITGLYMNPAGTAFLAPGAHFSFNIQNAKQSRDIETTFELFGKNVNNNEQAHKFEGDAYAPVIPSIQFSYNWEKWSINANFALGGGGGKCEFDKGLGSFEALYALQLDLSQQNLVDGVNDKLPNKVIANMKDKGLPEATAAQLAGMGTYNSSFAGYGLNAYMKGRQYYFGLSVGATYKALDNLAVFGGLRAVYATNNYNGYVQDVKASMNYNIDIPAIPGMFPGMQNSGSTEVVLDDRALTLNTDQTGFGMTPMLGVDWKINEKWNVAAKYEFKTRLRLENKSEMNEMAQAQASDPTSPISQFKDGSKIAADIPSLFTVGVQYAPISALRIQAGFHTYGDKNATQYGNKQNLIDNNTWEITAGVEYDICKLITVSGGWQTTQYGLSDAYMNDLSFTTNSNSWGIGARINCTEKLGVDLGFMQTIYQDRSVTDNNFKNSGFAKTDTYSRTNRVLGIGLNYNF